MGDIERAAKEAGIDPVYIRMAAVNVPVERQEGPSTADSATLSTVALYLLFHIGTVALLTILIRQQVWFMLPCWALCVFLGGWVSLGKRQARLVGAAIPFAQILGIAFAWIALNRPDNSTPPSMLTSMMWVQFLVELGAMVVGWALAIGMKKIGRCLEKRGEPSHP